jgi:hypothetical protein
LVQARRGQEHEIVDRHDLTGGWQRSIFDLTPERHQGVTARGIRWIPRLEMPRDAI